MNSKYIDLFDTLVKAYYEGNFDDTLDNIMVCHEKSPQDTFNIITSLCGVDVKFDNNYKYNLKKAITTHAVTQKIVKKLDCSSTNCSKDNNNKFTCQRACPFNAIMFDNNNNSTYINNDICINCGICIDSCKNGRILDKVEFFPIIDLIKNNKTVIAAVAPAIIGQFGKDVSMDQLREAFISIGFSDMIEVAFAADLLTIKESVEFNKHVKSPKDLMITSCCCPMWVGMLKKVYKELMPDLSPSVSPMIAAGRIIKALNPEAKVVFIGPCIAKKAEAKEKDVAGAIDFVLTFQELNDIFNALSINPKNLKGIPSVEYTSTCGRSYARVGGVTKAIKDTVKELYPNKIENFRAYRANGIKECKEILNDALAGNINFSFLEGMGCVGGCVGGPKILISPEEGKEAVDKFAHDSSIKVPVFSPLLQDILVKLNITSLEDFINDDKIKILKRDF